DVVGGGAQLVVRERDLHDAGVDVEDVAAGLSPGRPRGAGVLDDHPAGEVAELAEVRVVEVDVEIPVGDAACELDARPAGQQVEGRAVARGRACLRNHELRLHLHVDVGVRTFDGQGDLGGERRGG